MLAANNARREKALNRWYRDRVTNEVYTHQTRLDTGAYAYRTIEVTDREGFSYGLILASEIAGEVCYLTPVVPCVKMVYDYANLPVIEFYHDTYSVKLLPEA